MSGNVSFCCAGTGERQILNNRIGIVLTNGATLQNGDLLRIEGNSNFGIFMSASQASLRNTSLTGNGTAGNPIHAAIEVLSNSHLTLRDSAVTDNPSHGLFVSQNSSTFLRDATIADNGGDGVRLEVLSSANLSSGNDLSGNGQSDLSCDESSIAVAGVACPGGTC